MKKKAAAAAGLILAAGALGTWWFWGDAGEGPPHPSGSGTVEATESHLSFQLPGRIATLHPREGDRVEAGEVLGWLDRREAQARVEGAEGGVEAARALLEELRQGARPQELARAEAALRAAEATAQERLREADRASRLAAGGAISREAADRAATAAAVAQAGADEARETMALLRQGPRREQVAAQEARVRQGEGALEQAMAALENTALVAPFSGVVAIRHREPGETVGPGAPVLTLRDLDDRWVRIFVPGDVIGRVHPGQRAEIRGDSHPQRLYSGEVFFVGSQAEFTPRNVQTAGERTRLVYPVRVRILDDPEVELKPGLPADVVLRGDTP